MFVEVWMKYSQIHIEIPKSSVFLGSVTNFSRRTVIETSLETWDDEAAAVCGGGWCVMMVLFDSVEVRFAWGVCGSIWDGEDGSWFASGGGIARDGCTGWIDVVVKFEAAVDVGILKTIIFDS